MKTGVLITEILSNRCCSEQDDSPEQVEAERGRPPAAAARHHRRAGLRLVPRGHADVRAREQEQRAEDGLMQGSACIA